MFTTVTMIIDGKDIPQLLSRTSNESRRNLSGKSNLISRKKNWRKSGKLVFLDDIRGFPISVTKDYGANEKYDGHVMKEMEIFKLMEPATDCLIFDNHFFKATNKIANDVDRKKEGFGLKNFCPNFTKPRGKKLNPDQELYHSHHGALRSKIESERNADLVKRFQFFSKYNKKKSQHSKNSICR